MDGAIEIHGGELVGRDLDGDGDETKTIGTSAHDVGTRGD